MRELLLNNFRWKLIALLLAMLAWHGFQPRENRPQLLPNSLRPYFTRQLISHPVTISKQATDLREFKVTPSVVDITVSGEERDLRDLSDLEIRPTAHVGDLAVGTNSVLIQVPLPAGKAVQVERIVPERVQVEVFPARPGGLQ